MADSGRSLDQLRTELGDIDRELIELVARRQKLALEIGAVKRSAGKVTRDYRQERDVVERARSAAAQLGLSASLAEQMMLMLIRSSLTVQEQDRVASVGSGSGKRALVIGGAGKMGRWFVRFLASQGYQVEIADPAAEPSGDHAHVSDWSQVTLDHDLIVVAASMTVSNGVLLEMAKSPPPGVVFDIGSLKSPLREGLRALAAAGGRVTSIHPMFGPKTDLLSGRHVIFIDLGSPAATAAAKALFAATMAVLVDMDLESHDHLIAYVLGLSHALNLAFATALAESGEAAPRLAKLSSTTFDAQLAVARNVAEDNPPMYFEIQHLNDYGTESLTALLYAVERLRSLVRAGDQQGFVTLMQRCRDYLRERPRGDEAPP